jgi:beta-mannosidase
MFSTISLLVCPLLFLVGSATEPEVVHLGTDAGNRWTMSNGNGTLTTGARVPGCVHTDLLAADLIGEPNFGANTKLQRWIASDNFTYTSSFVVPSSLLAKRNVDLQLVGLDTAVAVSLNGKTVLSAANMHRTFMVDVSGLLHTNGTNNTLVVAFTGPVPASAAAMAACASNHGKLCADAACACPVAWAGPSVEQLSINAYIRKEQQSFGWDFAPPSGTSGITAEPLLVGYDAAVLRGVVVDTRPLGSSDTGSSDTGTTNGWTVTISVRLWSTHGPAPGSSTGVLSVAFAGLDVSAQEPTLLAVGETVKTLTINIPANKSVERWWPNGYGSQRLYPLEVTFAPGLAPGEEGRGVPAVQTSKTVNVGFRTVAIEQPALADGQGKLNSRLSECCS